MLSSAAGLAAAARAAAAALRSGPCSACLLCSGRAFASSGGSQDETDDMVAAFKQKVAALQDGQAQPDLKALFDSAPVPDSMQQQHAAGGSAEPQQAPAQAQAQAQQLGDTPHAVYGYAVLGGINPEASQLVAGAQQPKLHPTRDFRHAEVYDPQDLSPLAREEEEPWVPRLRRWRREPRPSKADVAAQLDYKNVDFLLHFVSQSGRLKPRRATGLGPVQQAHVSRTVKFARQMALLPYEMRVGVGAAAAAGGDWRRLREYRAASGEGRGGGGGGGEGRDGGDAGSDAATASAR